MFRRWICFAFCSRRLFFLYHFLFSVFLFSVLICFISSLTVYIFLLPFSLFGSADVVLCTLLCLLFIVRIRFVCGCAQFASETSASITFLLRCTHSYWHLVGRLETSYNVLRILVHTEKLIANLSVSIACCRCAWHSHTFTWFFTWLSCFAFSLFFRSLGTTQLSHFS